MIKMTFYSLKCLATLAFPVLLRGSEDEDLDESLSSLSRKSTFWSVNIPGYVKSTPDETCSKEFYKNQEMTLEDKKPCERIPLMLQINRGQRLSRLDNQASIVEFYCDDDINSQSQWGFLNNIENVSYIDKIDPQSYDNMLLTMSLEPESII